MEKSSENEVIRRAQAGDHHSLTELYETYYGKIYKYLYYRLSDVSTAEDLTQEVFIRMIRSVGQFQLDSISFQAWLFQIARNLAIDHYRKHAKEQHTSYEENVMNPAEPVDKTVQRNLDQNNLRLAIQELPEDQREVVTLRFIIGFPIQETAQILHKSEDSVKGLQRRGLVSLRKILRDWEVTYVS